MIDSLPLYFTVSNLSEPDMIGMISLKFPSASIYENGKVDGTKYIEYRLPRDKTGGIDYVNTKISLLKFISTDSII